MEVIGAGLPRTGTQSLKKAFDILGYKCGHMESLMEEKMILEPWYRFIVKGQPMDWEQLYPKQGYNAVVDYPAAAHYKELVTAFPNAKVILSVRDVKGWIPSWEALITTFSRLFYWFMLPFARCIGWRHPIMFWETTTTLVHKMPHSGFYHIQGNPATAFGWGEWVKFDDEASRRFFEEHNAAVKEFVPKNRLLVFDVREGWEPLCAFLGKPIPDVPFPCTNSGTAGPLEMARRNFMQNFKKTFGKGGRPTDSNDYD
eukprot:TRINITY_DN31254_c0_g1_i1.p1 TRINITY_DN31254_c0_g1~~TRINITY_DN31254_c0_g1_i1.p1  ORF type:complete len:290 (-),score=50.23 TRINITY_DN31254_c0_g1_i1:275-1045(-)